MGITSNQMIGLGAFLAFDVDPAVRSMGMASAKIVQLRHSFATLGHGVARVRQGVVAAATGMATAVGAIGLATYGSFKQFAQFNDSLIKLGTLMDEGTAGAMKHRSAIEEMSFTYAKAAKEVSEGFYQAISAGIKERDVSPFMDTVNKLSTAGYVESQVASKVLASTVNAWNLEVSKAVDIADVFFVANKRGALDVQELSRYFGMASASAAQAGIGYDELAGAAAVLSNTGLRTRVVMTGLNQAIMNIVKPTKQAKEVAKELGISFDVDMLRTRGLVGSLEYLAASTQKYGRLNEEQIATLFGSIEAYRGIVPLIGKMRDQYVSVMDDMAKRTGITEKKFAEAAKSYTFKMGQVKQVFLAGARSIGEAFVDEFGLAGVHVYRFKDVIQSVGKTAHSIFGGIRDIVISMDLPGAFRTAADAWRSLTGWLQSETGKKGMPVVGQIFLLGTAFTAVRMLAFPLIAVISGIGTVAFGAVQATGGLIQALGLLAGKWRGVAAAQAAAGVAGVGSLAGPGTAAWASRAAGARSLDVVGLGAGAAALPSALPHPGIAPIDPRYGMGLRGLSPAAPPGGRLLRPTAFATLSTGIGTATTKLGGFLKKIPLIGSMNPLVLAVAASVGMIATNAGGARDALGRVMGALTTVGKDGVEALSPVGAALKGIWEAGGTVLAGGLDGIANNLRGISALVDMVKSGFSGIGDMLGLTGIGATDAILDARDKIARSAALRMFGIDEAAVAQEDARRKANDQEPSGWKRAGRALLSPGGLMGEIADSWEQTKKYDQTVETLRGHYLQMADAVRVAREQEDWRLKVVQQLYEIHNDTVTDLKSLEGAAKIGSDAMLGQAQTMMILTRVYGELGTNVDYFNGALNSSADYFRTGYSELSRFVPELLKAQAAFEYFSHPFVSPFKTIGQELRDTFTTFARIMKIEVINKILLDGNKVNRGLGRAKLELAERAGAQTTPWQRRVVMESGELITRVN